jgi:hypothetical protein
MFPYAALVDAAAVVEVVEDVEEVVELGSVEDIELEVAPSASNSVATFRSAATMAGVGGAAPKVVSSDWATGPTTNRMYWANF